MTGQLSMPRVEIYDEGIHVPPPDLLDDVQWELMQLDIRALFVERMRRARAGEPRLAPGEWAICDAGRASWDALAARAQELADS